MLITRVGVILMEPTEFPLALPNCPLGINEGCYMKEICLSILTRGLVNHNQRLETTLLQNVSILDV